MITAEQIKRFAPNAKSSLVSAIVDGWPKAVKAGIEKTPARLHAFFATMSVETGGLRSIDENLNYSAKRLTEVWPKRFPTLAAAQPYANNPKALGIKVYGGRLGNKKAPSSDGYDFRGGGMLQTTGRDNYRAMGFEDNPEALRDPDVAFETAVREWTSRKCNSLADKGDRRAVRLAVNGGYNGYDEFSKAWDRAAKVWPTVGTAPLLSDEIDRPYAATPEDDPPEPLPREDRPDGVYTDKATVASTQSKLYDLGYTEVGAADGKIGKMTKTAILAFRNEHDLPVNDTIDDELLRALQGAEPRVLAQDRTEATPAEVRAQVPEVQSNWLSRAWGWFLGGGAVTVAGASSAGEADPDQRGLFKSVLHIIQDIPPWMWAAVVLVVAVAIIYTNHRGVKAGEQAYRDGARR